VRMMIVAASALSLFCPPFARDIEFVAGTKASGRGIFGDLCGKIAELPIKGPGGISALNVASPPILLNVMPDNANQRRARAITPRPRVSCLARPIVA